MRATPWLAFVLLMPSAPPGVVEAAQSTPLAGTWALNVEQSDRPNRATVGQGPDASAAYGGITGSSSASIRAMALMRPPLELVISLSGAAVTVAPERGYPITLVPGGRPTVDTPQDGQRRIIRGKLRGARLEIESEYPGVGKVKERYQVDSATGSLIVEVEVRPDYFPRTIKFRRVYDRSEGAGR